MPMSLKTVPCTSGSPPSRNTESFPHLDERELDLGKTANARSNADEYERTPWRTSSWKTAALAGTSSSRRT